MRSEQDYQAAADWAEHEMDLSRATGGTVRRCCRAWPGVAGAGRRRAGRVGQGAAGPAEYRSGRRPGGAFPGPAGPVAGRTEQATGRGRRFRRPATERGYPRRGSRVSDHSPGRLNPPNSDSRRERRQMSYLRPVEDLLNSDAIKYQRPAVDVRAVQRRGRYRIDPAPGGLSAPAAHRRSGPTPHRIGRSSHRHDGRRSGPERDCRHRHARTRYSGPARGRGGRPCPGGPEQSGTPLRRSGERYLIFRLCRGRQQPSTGLPIAPVPVVAD